jgi:hypothetical protein
VFSRDEKMAERTYINVRYLLRGGGMRRGDLLASLSVRQRQCVDQVLDHLIAHGQVRASEHVTPWSTGTYYEWVRLPVPPPGWTPPEDAEVAP